MRNTRPQILMCPPTYFEPAPAHPLYGFANAYEARGRMNFEKDPAGFKAKAMEQWLALRDVFSRFADIVELEPQPGKPDMVFTADASFSLAVNGRTHTLLAKFTNANRDEAQIHAEKLRAVDPARTLHESPYPVEAGDLVYDPFRDCVWGGHHNDPKPETAHEGRTHRGSHMKLSKVMGTTVIGLKTGNPAYHLDTTLGALPRGHLIVNKSALSDSDFNLMLRRGFNGYRDQRDMALDPGNYIIPVPDRDRENFSANIRCFGNTVVMPRSSPEMANLVSARGYDVIMVDLGCFQDGGGSVRCLSNIINEPRIRGGHISNGTAPEPH